MPRERPRKKYARHTTACLPACLAHFSAEENVTTDGGTPSSDICSSKDSTESNFPAVAQASMAVVKATTFGDNPADRATARSSRAWAPVVFKTMIARAGVR